MRKYEKPSIRVMDLQLKENIAAVPTTIFRGTASGTSATYNAANVLKKSETGLDVLGDLVILS